MPVVEAAPLLPASLPFLGAVDVAGALFRRTEGGAFLLVERFGLPTAGGRYAFLGDPAGPLKVAMSAGFAELTGPEREGFARRVFVLAQAPGDVQWVLVVELTASLGSEPLGRALQGYLAARVDAVEHRALQALPAWLRPDAQELARRAGPLVLLSEPGCGADRLARALVLARFLRDDAAVFWEPAPLSSAVQLRDLFGEAAGRRLGGPDPARVPLAEGPDRAIVILEASGLSRSAQLRLHSLLAGEEGRGRLWIFQSCRNLEAMVKAGRFDPGLWSRIRDAVFVLPPLRARRDEIASEVRRLLAGFRSAFRRELECSPAALDLLLGHNWPGNWLELVRVLERAFLLAPGPEIRPEDIVFGAPGDENAVVGSLDLRGRSEDLERQLLLRAYALHAGNQVHMARALGISRGSLQYKLEKQGLLGLAGQGEVQDES